MSDHIIDVSALRAGITTSETVNIIQRQRARILAERVLVVRVAAYAGTGTWLFTAFRADDAGVQPSMLLATTTPVGAVGWVVFTPTAGLKEHVFPATVNATLTGVSTIDYQLFMIGRDSF
ncbi:MAG: hypothetical protein ACE5HD_13080 [Acidobacteriota bacterium]